MLFLCAVCALCVLCTPAFAQIADPFAAYHQSLDRTADAVLAAAQQPPSTDVIGYVSDQSSSASSVSSVVKSSVTRVQQLRPTLDPILREEGVPAHLAAVVLVESGGRLTALSPKGALGLWQLMPATARRCGLTVSPEKDERLDVAKSTRAAARYLRDLYAHFGDWQLSLAAYNAGERRVQRAVTRVASGDFLTVSALLPAETRSYVPAVVAAAPLFSETLTGGSGSFLSGGLPGTPTRRFAARVVYAVMNSGN